MGISTKITVLEGGIHVKRVHVLERPMSVSDIDSLEIDDYGKEWSQQRAERVRLRKWRKVKHQTV